MAARPAKRLRRSTITVSDDEDFTPESSRLPVRLQQADPKLNETLNTKTFSKAAQIDKKPSSSSAKTSSTRLSPNPSPRKSRKGSKQVSELQNNKSLHSFFSRATEEQRWQARANTPQQESQEDSVVDDIIDDDFSDDELTQSSQAQSVQSARALSAKLFADKRTNGSKSAAPVSSQKFTKPAASSRLPISASVKSEPESSSEHKPWADRYRPTAIDELAVHKKKVADVQKWLEDVSAGRSSQRILVLKGPAGSGKSTTMSLITQKMGMNVVSWHNPVVSETGTESSIQQFEDFLGRGGQFEALSFGSTVACQQQAPVERQLLMVEEFPITMTRSSNMLDAFRSVLLQHILRNTKTPKSSLQPSHSAVCQPVVLVISETLLTSSTALSDSFTAHRLLGPELSHHPLVSTIEFNPVAPTFISKAIELVMKKEARESKRRRMPGPAVLQQLVEVGDIRSAINSLEFLCARGDNATDWSGTVASTSKKTSKSSIPLTEVEKNTLQLISQRESTLDMFHAVGKIVYNKREDPRVLDSRAEPPPKPPDHLMYLYTSKVSQVDVDALLNDAGTDIQTFISTLHENYVLSCNGDEFVDAFEGCSQSLSESDFLNPESRSLIRAKGSSRTYSSNVQSGNFDMLRQDEISFQVASRGLLFSLPFPVNRAVPAGMRKQDAFKMFYPASLRLWKPAEEIYDLVNLYADKVMDDDSTLLVARKNTTGVASWKSRSFGLGTISNHEDVQNGTSPSSRSLSSRDNLVTELLPYLTFIRAAQKKDVHVLRKITQLRGINISGDELLDEEQYDVVKTPSAATRLQQKVEEAHNMLQAQKLDSARGASAGSTRISQGRAGDDTIGSGVEKMYISDDDIQDD